MIKRLEFAGAGAGSGRDAGGAAIATASGTEGRPAGWQQRVDAALDAAPDVRPLRITWCAALDDIAGDPPHTGVGLEWFTDAAHLGRFDAWVTGTHPDATAVSATADPSEPDPVIVAVEHVMRGEDWLEHHWREGTTSFKHLAVARRAAGLTPAEFADRWRTGAGRVQGPGDRPALVIPDDVRGCAYVQNHPLPRSAGEWAYDAVNEVSFDDLHGLRTRIAWFAEHVGAGAEPELIARHAFLATAEVVVLAPTG